MRQAVRAVFGLRPDLELSKRWWHRLFLVAFVLVVGAAFLLGSAVAHRDPPPLSSNVRVIDNLSSYTKAHPELANTVPSFRRLGRTGHLLPEGGVEQQWLSESDTLCNADLTAHLEEVTAFLQRNTTGTQRASFKTEEDVALFLRERESSGRDPVCLIRRSRPKPSQIVAWEFRPAARVGAVARALSLGALVAAGLALVLTNVYYRGLIYVIFGRTHGP